jgi:hypothetical protein
LQRATNFRDRVLLLLVEAVCVKMIPPEPDSTPTKSGISREEIRDCLRRGLVAAKREREIMRLMTTPTWEDLKMRYR